MIAHLVSIRQATDKSQSIDVDSTLAGGKACLIIAIVFELACKWDILLRAATLR